MEPIINTEYSFKNLVVGSSNQFAYAASKAVTTSLGNMYNPLIIYGGVGLGKTHLLHAIAVDLLSKDCEIVYSTFENFFNEMRKHIQHHTMEEFKLKYRKCDILLLDDIQFLEGKKVGQEEFFNTFNDLKNAGRQIVVTSDVHPKDLQVENRIKNRFEGGLITEVLPPDLETKKKIIRKKVERNGMNICDDSINYIATNIIDNVRIIEGLLLKVHAYSVLMDEKVTLDFIKHVVEETKTEIETVIELKHIINTVANQCNVKPSEMKSRSRSSQIVKARRIALFLSRELTPTSMSDLAKEFNMKDHTSVSHAVAAARKLVSEKQDFMEETELIKTLIQKTK